MPSTTSSSVSMLFASSTVITPSFPTFSMASAIMSPMPRSPLADTVPTCAISSRLLVALESFFSSPTTASTARSTPRLRLIGSCPAATSFAPSAKIARASTVAVVVPSPATSEVLEATSFTICAPMFSNLSGSSTSLATVTPSLVTVGAPQDFSSTTFRPRGPSVTVTASARMPMPRSTFERASSLNRTIFAAIDRPPLGFDHAEDVLFAEDQVLLAVDLDLAACVLSEEHAVSRLHVERHQLPIVPAPRADRHHLAFLRLLLGGVGNNDPTGAALLFCLDSPDDDSILQRSNLHRHRTLPPPGPSRGKLPGSTVGCGIADRPRGLGGKPVRSTLREQKIGRRGRSSRGGWAIPRADRRPREGKVSVPGRGRRSPRGPDGPSRGVAPTRSSPGWWEHRSLASGRAPNTTRWLSGAQGRGRAMSPSSTQRSRMLAASSGVSRTSQIVAKGSPARAWSSAVSSGPSIAAW